MRKWLWRGLQLAGGVAALAMACRFVQYRVQSLSVEIPATPPSYLVPQLDPDFTLTNALEFLDMALPDDATEVQVVAYEERGPGYFKRLVMLCFRLPATGFDGFIAALDWAGEWQTRDGPFYARHRRAFRDGLACGRPSNTREYQVALEQATVDIDDRSTSSRRQIIVDQTEPYTYWVLIEGDFYFGG